MGGATNGYKLGARGENTLARARVVVPRARPLVTIVIALKQITWCTLAGLLNTGVHIYVTGSLILHSLPRKKREESRYAAVAACCQPLNYNGH